MEMILAIVVAAAVIFFGALISIGNERQRKAIDALREQTELWALQDLKIKREHLARTVQVPDPLGWFNYIASNECGHDVKLKVLDTFVEPPALNCAAVAGKILFSPISPSDLHRIKLGRYNRLGKFSNLNPMLTLPRGVIVHELSALNCGFLFDQELAVAWQEITSQRLDSTGRFWMYEYSE